jgi:altronate dehydratase
MYRRMEEDMDVNCGTIVDGEETVQQAKWRIFHLILRVASGERTKVSNTISVPQSSHRGRSALLFDRGDY